MIYDVNTTDKTTSYRFAEMILVLAAAHIFNPKHYPH